MNTPVITACCGETMIFLAQLRREGAKAPELPVVALWAAQSVAPKMTAADHRRIARLTAEQLGDL
jgi:hypothetical protein